MEHIGLRPGRFAQTSQASMVSPLDEPRTGLLPSAGPLVCSLSQSRPAQNYAVVYVYRMQAGTGRPPNRTSLSPPVSNHCSLVPV